MGVEAIRETDPDGVPLANGTFLDAGMYVDQFLTGAGIVDTLTRGNTDLVMDQINYYYQLATGHAPPP